MTWKQLTTDDDLDALLKQSFSRSQVVFKHSTRCSISSVVKSRLDKKEAPEAIDFYYLDLIKYRSLSDKIAELTKVGHESPQVIIIRNGQSIYDESHASIYMDDILEQANVA